MSRNRFFHVLLLSISLLMVAILSARAHAGIQGTSPDKFDLIDTLKSWQSQTSLRRDLEAFEKDQRLDFIQRLIFQIDRKYRAEDLTQCLIGILTDMIHADHKPFYSELKQSLETLLERNENPLLFIRSFTEFSSLSHAKTVDEFAETRSYSDGQRVLAAQTPDLEQVSAKLDELEQMQNFLIPISPEIPAKDPWLDLLESYSLQRQAI